MSRPGNDKFRQVQQSYHATFKTHLWPWLRFCDVKIYFNSFFRPLIRVARTQNFHGYDKTVRIVFSVQFLKPTSRINPIMVAPIVLKANNGDEPLHTDGRIFTEFYPLLTILASVFCSTFGSSVSRKNWNKKSLTNLDRAVHATLITIESDLRLSVLT